MSYFFIPKKIKSFFDLIRLNKPTGFLLLMWPCWFALAITPINYIENIKWFLFFFIGSFLMRSAGCIVNDIIDINIDNKTLRTSQRPLVAKTVKIYEACILLIILLILSFLILLQFNSEAILIGCFSIPLIFIYPFMKRFTHWPQLVLGITFNWGVLIVSTQFNDFILIQYVLLYLACIFWTLGYDTIYAYQDRLDDINNEIKSTAVLFGSFGKIYVISFYSFFLTILGIITFQISNSITSIFLLIMILIAMIFFLNKWDINSKKSSNRFFRLNNLFGLTCFIYLIIF